MKRFIALCAAVASALMLSGCGGPSRAVGADNLSGGLRGLRIAIDPGHGGIDNGAAGTDTGVQEDTLNLEISQLIAKKFMLAGSDVLLTRKSDDVDYSGDGGTLKRRDMNNRARLIAAQNADIVVSIHMNKYPNRKLSGAQVFYEQGSDEGSKLAQCIQDSLNADMGYGKKFTAKAGNYFILKVSKSPSVIVECGFLSNHDEEKKLLDPGYRVKLAECVYNGICSYLGIG